MLRLRPVLPNTYILQSLALGAGACRQAGNKNFSNSIIIIRVIGILSLSLLLEPRCACSIAQSCPPLCDPLDCTLPGSSVHGILQARVLERVAVPSSRGSS